MIGLDTTAIIDWFKGENRLQRVLRENPDSLASTQVNYVELLFGLDLTLREHQREKEFYEEFFSRVTHFTLNSLASQKTAEIFWTLKKKGVTIDPFDCAIAGILQSHGVHRIITRNVKHFEKIPGIKVITY